MPPLDIGVSGLDHKTRQKPTLNWKFCALGDMTVISWAVEALWSALAPGLAKETLPTSTLCTTVL